MSWNARKWHIENNHKQYREAESTHHRKPRSQGGKSNAENLSELPRSRHAAWHNLFQNWTPDRIAEEINDRYLDPDFKMVAVPLAMHVDIHAIVDSCQTLRI